jgi:hypothetical protein
MQAKRNPESIFNVRAAALIFTFTSTNVTQCVLVPVDFMGKYEPLGAFLRKQRAQEVPLTFSEIEKIIGVKLPPKAQHHRAWWSNNSSNNVMTRVWLESGFESTQVDLRSRRLVFRRVSKSSGEDRPPAPKKGERHPIFGALKDVTFVPAGIDLTEPADPDWGKVYD